MTVRTTKTSFRSIFKAYGVGFSVLLLSASFYYVKQGYIDQLSIMTSEVREIESLRTLAINDPSCNKPGIDKGFCAAKVFEKKISSKQWTETGKVLNRGALIAFLSRSKQSTLSCGVQSREAEIFLAMTRMESKEKSKTTYLMAKKLKAKMGRAVASTKFKEAQCIAVMNALKHY